MKNVQAFEEGGSVVYVEMDKTGKRAIIKYFYLKGIKPLQIKWNLNEFLHRYIIGMELEFTIILESKKQWNYIRKTNYKDFSVYVATILGMKGK